MTKFDGLSEETQKYLISIYPLAISYITNPSEKLQLIALSNIFNIKIKCKIINKKTQYFYKFDNNIWYKYQSNLIKKCNDMNIDYSIYVEDSANIFLCFDNKENYVLFKLLLK